MAWHWYSQPQFQKKPVYVPGEKPKTPPPQELICTFCGKRVMADTELVLGKEVLRDLRGSPCPRCNNQLVAFKHIVDDIEEPF